MLYADDLVLMSQSKQGLQVMLDALSEFARGNLMTVNLTKTVVMAFRAVAQVAIQEGTFTYNGAPVSVVKEFAYLGVRFRSASRRTRTAVCDNLDFNLKKAQTSERCMSRRCQAMPIHNAAVRCHLFGVLVTPVLSYGCTVWGVDHMHGLSHDWGMDGVAENFHRKFLRAVFRVPDSVTNAVLMHESRRMPLKHAWCKQIIGWWNRILARPADDLVRQALTTNVAMADESGEGFWSCGFQAMLRVCGAAESVTQLLPVGPGWLVQLSDGWQRHLWGA